MTTYTHADFLPFKNGEAALPNPTPIAHEDFLKNVASFGHSYAYMWGYSLYAGRKVWTAFFCNIPQGNGMAVSYVSGTAFTVKFEICQHEKVLRPTDRPNPQRGWHPGVCAKCGMNMNVDSGD